MSLKILSANCNGLGDVKKQDLFPYLKNLSFDIYCLQDTRFSPKKENDIQKKWGGKCFFSSLAASKASRGVAILLNENFAATVSGEQKDPGGNYLMLTLSIQKKRFLLCNIYGPNRDTPSFYDKLQKDINEMEFDCGRVILCGDFNLVLNPDIDYTNYIHVNNPLSRRRVLQLMEDNNLVDVFRERNLVVKSFTWTTSNESKKSRLDFFLISESLWPYHPESCIVKNDARTSTGKFDHSMITLSLDFQLLEFDNSLLSDKKFVESIHEMIQREQSQHSDQSCEDEAVVVNDQVFLENLLEKIRVECISYRQCSRNIENSMNDSKNVHEQRVWPEEEESRNISSGIIPRIKLENGRFIDKQSDILSETKENYKKLYDRKGYASVEDRDRQENLPFSNIKKLADKDSSSLEGPITLEQATETLNRLKSNRLPGSDGFTLQFFKDFWENLGAIVVRSINYAYDKKKVEHNSEIWFYYMLA